MGFYLIIFLRLLQTGQKTAEIFLGTDQSYLFGS
jgi:hypothetical protein